MLGKAMSAKEVSRRLITVSTDQTAPATIVEMANRVTAVVQTRLYVSIAREGVLI